jgi:hypothetical protein
MNWKATERLANLAQIPLTLVAYIGLGYSLWPRGSTMFGSPKNINWQAILAASLVIVGLASTAASVMPVFRKREHDKGADAAPSETIQSLPSALDRLIPRLERRYIKRKQPPRGKPLPADWLKEEAFHLEMDLRLREFDYLGMDGLDLPYDWQENTVENPQDLSQCDSLIRGAWARTERQYQKVLEMFSSLSATWFSFQAYEAGNEVRLPGSDGKILLTPEIFVNIQDQAKNVIMDFRLHFLMFESLLRSIELKDPRADKGKRS